MSEDYTDIVKRRIDLHTNVLNTCFYYPKVIIIYDHGVNISSVEDIENNDTNYNMEENIVEAMLQDHILWIALASGKLAVIDILQEVQLKFEQVSHFAIQKLKNVDGTMYFISEGEELLISPYSTKDLMEQMNKGITEMQIELEKVRGRQKIISIQSPRIHVDGLELYIDQNNVIAVCPFTGLSQTITVPTGINLKHILPWDQFLVLADENVMWVFDMNNVKLILEYKMDEVIFLPIGTYMNDFYYINKTVMETKVCCIKKASLSLSKSESSLNENMKKSDSQEMLKSQVRSLIDTVKIHEKDPAELLKLLKPLFKSIDDITFLIDVGTKLCQNNIAYKPLLYIILAKFGDPDDSALIKQLFDLIFKVDITEYIIFKGNNCYNNVNIFDLDFVQLCISFISNSDFDLASLCWLKYSEIKASLTSDEILSILNAIPHNTKLSSLVIWLKNFAPKLLALNPFHLDLFARWTTERIFALENSSYWPKIGLKFIDEVTSVLDLSLTTIVLRPISMDDLDLLKNRITEITEAKESFKIKLSLSELCTQNPSEVSLIMLHRCYTEDLEIFLDTYLPTYAIRHHFELDETLRSYIENVAATGGGSIDAFRFRIILNAFRTPSNKLNCLLSVLRYLDVPWDVNINSLAVEATTVALNDFTLNEADRNLARKVEEEINFANLKVVLKKYNYSLAHTDYMLVVNKIINAQTVDVKDLKIIMSVSTVCKYYGSLLYLDRCLRDCNVKQALEYFCSLPEKENRIVLKSVMSKYENILSNNISDDSVIERCYIDFFKGVQLLDDVEIMTIENMYHLKNSHNTILTMNDMYCEQSKNEFVDLNSADIMDTYTYRNNNEIQLLRTFYWRSSTLITELQKMSTSEKVRKFLNCIVATLDNISCEKMSSLLSNFMNGKSDYPFMSECSRILVQLLSKCSEEKIYHLLKVLSIVNAMINTEIFMRNLSSSWIFNYVYMPMSSFTSQNDLMTIYSKPLEEVVNLDFLLTKCNASDFLPFRLFANMLYSNAMDDLLIPFKSSAVKKLVCKVSVLQEPDELFLSSLLLIMSKETIENLDTLLLDTLKGTNETLPSGLVSYFTSPVVRSIFGNILSVNAVSYTPQYILKTKYNITLTDIALPDITEETWDVKLVFFYVLKQQPHMPLEQLIDLCRTLNIAIDDGMSLQVIAMLTTWSLVYKVYNDEFGRQKLLIENDEKAMTHKCSVLWESIKNKDFLKDILNDFWKNGEVSLHGRLISINPYFYEVYLCIYQLIFGATADVRKRKEYFLLNFLKDYSRKSTPQHYEFELFSSTGIFPEIGHFRLPFHLFMRDDMWLNLKSEITLETYERWLPAVALLSLDNDLQTAKDMICSNALKQTMKTRKAFDTDPKLKESEPWRLSPKEETLLRAAHRCVRHIANMEWAGACLFYVLRGCCQGADQVAASQLCYHFAQRWDALAPGNQLVHRMGRTYFTLATAHALHKIEWATDELLQLTSKPSHLIRYMYLHPKFGSKILKHDVNNATNEVAYINSLNISSIRIQILEDILDKKSGSTNFGLDKTELITAKYILKATCPKMGAIYLSRIAFDEETDFNKYKKVRALQCLMSIVESDTALKVANRQRDALWNTLLELYYVTKLEHFKLYWAVSAFKQDKSSAIDQILSANETDNVVLKLIAEIAPIYGDTQTITKIIHLMLRSHLYEDMIPLLLKVLTPPDDIIRSAWRAVLLSPFQNADHPITERQKSNCLKSINLLPLCPFIQDEDLIEIWKNCIRCRCFGIGCLILPYITNDSRQSLTELRKIDKRNLIASLKNLHADSYLVSGAMYVIEKVLSKSSYR